jgi:hypothetical protein
MANWAWPDIHDEDSARSAAHVAGGWAAAVAIITALLVLINLLSSSQIMGIGRLALIDSALFAIVAWRVWVGSRAWAVTGLVLYAFEITWNVVTHPPGVGILTIIIVLALINGVRGTFSLHKFLEMKRPEMQPVLASAASATYMPTTTTPPPPPPSGKLES